MKVAIVTTRHGAQDDRIYFKQALSLAKRFDVTLIAPDDGERLEWRGGIEFRPIPRRRTAMGRIWGVVEAIREVKRERPDFCHLHDLDLALAIPVIRLITHAMVIYDSHEVFTRNDLAMKSRLPHRLGWWVAGLIACLERVLVAASHQLVTAVDPVGLAFEGLTTPQRVIFNYPRLSVFHTDPEELSEAIDRYRGRLPIIYQGSMGRDRGLFHMLEALSLIVCEEPRVLLRLVGLKDEGLMGAVERLVADLGLQRNVEIGGWLPHEQVALAMKSSLIGLLPLQPSDKYQRALPIKLLEYMACGLPVVAARLALVESYVSQSGAGLLYDSTRPEELARRVLDLLADPERRRRMGEAGLRAVRERWNWAEMETVLFDVYDSLSEHLDESKP